MTDTAVSHSYITTIEDCDARLSGDPRTSAVGFLALEDAPKTWYLQRATKVIDALPLKGSTYYWIDSTSPTSDEQEFQFPRVINGYAIDWDDATSAAIVPEDVKRACLEEAIAIYAFYLDTDNVDRKSMREQGVSNYNLGGVYSESLGVSHAEKHRGLMSPDAYILMKPYMAGAVRPIP